MGRFWRGSASNRQARGWRNVKPATREERLASMQRELEKRIRVYGEDHWLTRMQRECIAREMAR
jgi:hypothetical protein